MMHSFKILLKSFLIINLIVAVPSQPLDAITSEGSSWPGLLLNLVQALAESLIDSLKHVLGLKGIYKIDGNKNIILQKHW